uniref:NADAR domain-containing protein n=1 Tax=Panagrolaimus superbus TaxID=310955 RepID=A0A914YQ98_9BILA
MYRHPYPKSHGGGRIMKKIPGGHSYETPAADVEVKEFPISTSNFEFFHGYNNMFTLQFWTDISIDDIVYKSVDHYYQKMKVFDLTGSATEKFDDPKIKNYSGVAREVLKENNISRKTVDEWRTSCGVEVIQKALLEKVKQSTAFRDHLLATGDKIICHPFPLDDFFGTGCPVKYVTDWATSMQQKDTKLKFPVSFPLTTTTAKNVPSIAKGRNMLGAIYIALREQIKSGNMNDLTVSLTPVDQTVKIKKTAPRIPTATMTRLIPPSSNQISSSNAVPLRNVVPLREAVLSTPTAPSNGYAGYTAGQPPMMYTTEQQQQFQNNRPSIASQLPEVPVAPDLRYFNNPAIQHAASSQGQQKSIPSTDQMYANYQSQQMQYQQQQQQHAQQQRPPTYASLAAQNQDFSMDVDSISGQHANTQVTRQVFQPSGAGNQSMYQGSYDWQW